MMELQFKVLGCCEHWNNPEDKQYTRNLKSGDGIELVYIKNNATDVNENNTNQPYEFVFLQNYPNPFNPTTKIKYSIPHVETNAMPRLYN